MFLIINTAESKRAIVALGCDDFLLDKIAINAEYKESEKLLPAIDKLLRKNKAKPMDLRGVAVVTGPGGFSSLRVGLATANALGYALKIPVVGVKVNEFEDLDDLNKIGWSRLKKVKVGEIVVPFYGREPNITHVKKLELSASSSFIKN